MEKKKLPNNSIVGERVEMLRKAKHMTQEELAKKLGYKSKSSVTHIENGRDVPRQIVEALAELLGTNPAFLMGWSDNPEPLVPWDSLNHEEQQEHLATIVGDTHPEGLTGAAKVVLGAAIDIAKKEVPDRAENPKVKKCAAKLAKMTDAELAEMNNYLNFLIWKRDQSPSED